MELRSCSILGRHPLRGELGSQFGQEASGEPLPALHVMFVDG